MMDKRTILRVAGLTVVMVAVVATIAVALVGPADIRPDSMPEQPDTQRARALLERLAERHGGLERWRQARATRVQLTDYWPDGMMKSMGCPWKEDESLDFTFLNARDMGRLTFRGSERNGQVWGIQHWRTYTESPSGERTFAQDDTIKFWLPTIQYFVELPFRILEADVVQYAGERELDGNQYDLVYATWHDAEPREDVDQYVLWINRKTGLLDYVQYTVRDMGKLITGTMHYEDFREVDGFTLPFRMTAGGTPEQPQTMHRMDLRSVELLPTLDESEIIVESQRRGSK